MAHASMETGLWLGNDFGTPTAGSIGVLMDTVLGGAAMQDRPANSWAVTTHLSLHFPGALPMDGSVVRGEATCLSVDARGAMASGRAYDASGNVVVDGSTWLQFTPGIPYAKQERNDAPPPHELPQSVSQILGVVSAANPTRLRFPANNDLLNAHGALHGGVVIALAEYAASRHPAVEGMELASLSTTFLRPGVGDLTVETKQTHVGGSLQMYEVIIANAEGRTCAQTSAIYRRGGH